MKDPKVGPENFDGPFQLESSNHIKPDVTGVIAKPVPVTRAQVRHGKINIAQPNIISFAVETKGYPGGIGKSCTDAHTTGY